MVYNLFIGVRRVVIFTFRYDLVVTGTRRVGRNEKVVTFLTTPKNANKYLYCKYLGILAKIKSTPKSAYLGC